MKKQDGRKLWREIRSALDMEGIHPEKMEEFLQELLSFRLFLIGYLDIIRKHIFEDPDAPGKKMEEAEYLINALCDGLAGRKIRTFRIPRRIREELKTKHSEVLARVTHLQSVFDEARISS